MSGPAEVDEVEAWIEFGRGTLFRLSFSLMVLGLLRILVLTIFEITAAYRRSSDRIVAWREPSLSVTTLPRATCIGSEKSIGVTTGSAGIMTTSGIQM